GRNECAIGNTWRGNTSKKLDVSWVPEPAGAVGRDVHIAPLAGIGGGALDSYRLNSVIFGKILRPQNIEHSTSNIQHPTRHCLAPSSMFGVGSSMLDVCLQFGSGSAGLRETRPTLRFMGSPDLQFRTRMWP